jgi:hypothetical protein
VAWSDSYEPEEADQYEDLKYWTKSNNKGYQHQSLDNSDDPKCPFKKLELRKFDWDDDYTVELRDNAMASSGALMVVPKNGHWVRLFIQANNNAGYFYQNLPEINLANVPTSWGVFQKDDAEALSPQILAFGGTGSSSVADGFLEIVLIGRPNRDPEDIIVCDVDEDWGWEYQDRTMKAFTLFLDGLGGSDGSNFESEIWMTLLDYGTTGMLTTGAIVPKTNSKGRDVNMQGLIPSVPNGYYWDFQRQEVREIDSGEPFDWGNESDTTQDMDEDDLDGGDSTTTTPPDPEDTTPSPASDTTLRGMYNLVKDDQASKTPFSLFNFSGGSSLRTWRTDDQVIIENQDRFWSKSGALLLEIRDGAMVELEIMCERKDYFSDIANSLNLDPQLIGENFYGGDSSFTVRLYGGNFIYCDPDKDYADTVALFGGFTLSTDQTSYTIDEPADQEFYIKLLNFGVDDRIKDDDDDDDNGEGGSNGGGENGETIPTDPFDLIDGSDTPFDETDGLTDRVIKSAVFGINNSFRAVEAVFEGFMIALPALIVIGSAVIVGKIAIGATEKGASKVVSIAKKAENSITNVSIEGVN